MNWIRLPKYLKDSGESRPTFDRLRNSGELYEGVHYQYDKANRIWVNVKAMESWLLGKPAKL